ncbi:MAG: dipeptidase PepE [Acidobacteriota bacterium]|nr:dipeptidase PepE [Acidobacteriota bacterium]
MRDLLLVSTSTVHGTPYLEHCAAAARELFAGCRRIAFVPHALFDRDGYAARVARRFADWDLEVESVHAAPDPAALVAGADGLFIGGGNTFRLLRDLHALDLVAPIRRRALAGMPYMGTSAGSNVACPTLRTTNDMPIVAPPSFEALRLVPFQINPHYVDPEPGSTHMGETRDQRLAEYHEENDLDVVALREGSMLRVRGDRMTLLGAPGGRLFRRGTEPAEIADGADVSGLLAAARG